MLKRTLSFVLVLTMLATCLFILPVSATEDSAFTYTKDAGYWYDRVVMDNETFLNRSYTPSGVTYAYDSDAKTASMSVSTSDNYKKFLDLTNLELNNESSGEVEVYMTIQPTKVSDDNWFPTKSTSSYWCLYLDSYIDGTRVPGGANQWKGLTTGYSSNGVYVTFPNSSSTKTEWTESTEIPVKFVITKNNGALTMKHYVNMGNGWIDGGTETTSTAASGSLTGLGFRFGSNSKDGQIKYILSDAQIIEKTPKTVRLSDVSGESYNLSDKKDVKLDFVLPQGVTEASLKLGEEEVADLTGQTAGAYTGTLDLAQIGKTGTFPVVLSGTANGAAFSTSTTLKINRPAFGSLDKSILSDPVAGGDYAERIAMTNDEFLAADKFSTGNTKVSYSKSGDTNIVGTVTQTGDTSTVAFAGAPDLIRMDQAGTQIVEIQGTVALTNYDYTKVKTVELQWIPKLNASTNMTTKDWKSLRNNADGGLYSGSSPVKKPYAGEDVQMKWRYTFTDSTTAGAKDVTMQHYFRLSDLDEWTEAADASTSKTGVTNATIGDIQLRLRLSGSPTENATWVLKNFSVKELASSEAAITDLSDQSYVGNELVPVSICLPANYKEAVLTAGDTDIATFKGVASGGYTANLSIAGLGKTGRIPLTLSGTTTDGKTFSASTNFYVAAPAAGSLDEELFTETQASPYYAEKVIMNSDEFLAGNAHVDTTSSIWDAPAASGGAASLTTKGYAYVKLNTVVNGTVDADVNVYELTTKVKMTNASTATGSPCFGFYPIIGETVVAPGSTYFSLAFKKQSSGSFMVYPYWSGTGVAYDPVNNPNDYIEYKVVVTVDSANKTANVVPYARLNDGEWVQGTGLTKSELTDTALTGWNLVQNHQSGATEGAYSLYDASVIEKAATTAEIRDLSAGFYTQYDTVPVDFNLPTGYKDAMITVDGTPVAVFDAATGDNAGSWQSKLNLEKLGKVGAVTIGLQGNMNGGGTFSKSTTLTVKAATAGADSVDWTKATVIDNAALTTTVDATADTGIYRPVYNATNNPNKPFLTQYALEYCADVDFSNVIPTISFEGSALTWTSGYALNNIQSKFSFPKRAFKLKLVFINGNFDARDGSSMPTNVTAYADDVCLGTVTINEGSSRNMNDHEGYVRLKFGKPTGYADEALTVKNFTVNKYSLISAVSAEMVSDNAVSVTLDRTMESSGISLAKADGTPIAATATVSGKTVTLTAESALPADVQVVFGTEAEEADYTFTGYIKGTSTADLTRLGEAITVPFAVSANNTAATLQGTDLKVWESGQNAIIKATVNELAGSNAKLIVAAYNDNNGLPKLVESKVETLSATEAGLKDYVFNLQFDNSYDYFKVFLWDATSGINALFDSQNTK